MRWFALVLLVLLAACDDNTASGDGACLFNGTRHAIGDVFPAGDNCNSCECTSSGPVCTERVCTDAGVDATPAACGASGGCPQGPACGAVCCRTGERCVGGVCRCGTLPGCGSGDTCEAAGPVGTDLCGSVCCGVSGPCPGVTSAPAS
jgi:hypothetical protein